MNLEEGMEITTKELMEWFGTKKQKEVYEKTKKLPQCTKKSILKQAESFCKITDLGKGKFLIGDMYVTPKEGSINSGDISDTLVPLILLTLIKNSAEEGKRSLSFADTNSINETFKDAWAESMNDNMFMRVSPKELAVHTGMVDGKKFDKVKNHALDYAHSNEYDIKIVEEVVDSLNRNFSSNLEKALKKLSTPKSKGGYNVCTYNYVTIIEKSGNFDKLVEDGKVSKDLEEYVLYKGKDRYHIVGTEKDNSYINWVIEKVKRDLNISSTQECFYGKHRETYKSKVKELLSKRDINFNYEKFIIRYNSLDDCLTLAEQLLGDYDMEEAMNSLRMKVRNNLLKNAQSRFENYPINLKKWSERLAELRGSDEEGTDFEEVQKAVKRVGYLNGKKYRAKEDYLEQYKGTTDYVTDLKK